MPDITVSITDAENKSLEYAALSVQDFADNALTHRAWVAGNEIISLLVEHCNANSIAIATGREAQIDQAYTLGVVDTAANVQAAFEAAQAEEVKE